MATSTQPSFNAGTGSFTQTNSKGSQVFTMSSASWLALQTYLHNTASLPTTLTALRGKMNHTSSSGSSSTSSTSSNTSGGAPTDMSDFQKLVDLYANMHAQSADFTGSLYPSVVSLASDVYHYAEAVPEYYAGLQELIKQLSATPAPTGEALKTIQTNLIAVLDQLADKIQPFITRAGTVKNDLNKFVSTLNGYLTTLGSNAPSPDGSGYWKYYHTEYGSNSAQVKKLTANIATQSANLHQYQAEYNHDVVVAATTPTYGWFYPFGTLAAVVTASVYGARATKAKHEIEATTTLIQSLTAEEQADANLMNDLNLVTTQVEQVHSAGETAISILEGMEGNWSAIASDLSNLSNLLKTDFEGTCGFLLQLDLNTAINDWKNLQREADVYRTNAFITVNP